MPLNENPKFQKKEKNKIQLIELATRFCALEAVETGGWIPMREPPPGVYRPSHHALQALHRDLVPI